MAKARPEMLLAAWVTALLLAGPAQAQQPTQAQQDAVRANCRSDFISMCRGVTPGGADALRCLKQNAGRLAPSCKTAVDAISPASPAPRSDVAPAAPSTTGAAPSPEPPMVVAQLGPLQMRNLQMACAGDAQIHCVGVPRDPQARIACLRDNAANLSPPCQQALRSLAAAMPGAAPAAAAAAPGAPAGQPTAEQQNAIRSNCRSDAMSLCPGQQGQAAFACLKQNASRLSPACRQAVAAVAGPSAPATAAPTRPAAPPAGATAQAQPTPDQQNAIRSNCRSDAMSLCRGQQGQAAFACLQSNSARLSPACRQAVSAVSGAPAAPAAAPAAAAPARAAAPAAAPVPATPAPAASAQPTQAQQDALRANCRNDFQSVCAGVQPGGQAALACLQTNSARLSSACRIAVSAIGAPAAGSAAPARPVPAPAAAPQAAPAAPAPASAPAAAASAAPSEAEQMATLGRSCGGDIQTHCKGVSLGAGRIMACLAANGAALSPQCRQALTEVSRSR